jgi:hypothetical protein
MQTHNYYKRKRISINVRIEIKRKRKGFVRFRRLYWQVILQAEVKFSVIVDQPGKEDNHCHQ